MTARANVVALLACLGVGTTLAGGATAAPARLVEVVRAEADGGSGTYRVTGSAFEFDLVNTGTTSWRYFELVGPSDATFVGGATIGESTAACSTGQPNVL